MENDFFGGLIAAAVAFSILWIFAAGFAALVVVIPLIGALLLLAHLWDV